MRFFFSHCFTFSFSLLHVNGILNFPLFSNAFLLAPGWLVFVLGKGRGVTELVGCWLLVVEMLNVVALTLAPALAAVVR